MEILSETRLATGEQLRILHWSAPEKAPRKYVDYVSASFGSNHPHNDFYTIGGWRAYFSDAMNGTYCPEVVDHWFFAEVDGECAGRMWFAYSARTRRGNFGNVMTEPQFQRRGIMTELLKYCMEEFYRSPAEILCCASGNPHAVASYLKVGFELIYGGETGPLCLSKKGSFLDTAQEAFSGNRIAEIRRGTIGDQFDCDKFLAYIPEIRNRAFPFRGGPSAAIPEFRLAFQEALGNRGTVNVALNSRNECVGYAFAAILHGLPLLDFTVHPGYLSDAANLIRMTADDFKTKFQRDLLYFGFSGDKEKLAAITEAGAECQGIISNALPHGDTSADMAVYCCK